MTTHGARTSDWRTRLEIDPNTLGIIIGAAIAAATGGTVGVQQLFKRGRKRRDDDGSSESHVSRTEAQALADRAAKDASTIAALEALRASIAGHEARDVERFAASEKRSNEQHGMVMAELARLGTKSHDHASKIMAHSHDLATLRNRIDETRRLANIDSGIHRNPHER